MKLPKNLKGKYVTRAAFAKMQAEKQRLYNDIKLMATGGAEGGIVWSKWRKHFKIQNEFNAALREIAKRELPALRLKYGIKDFGEPKLDTAKGAFK
jgi:hypothetical protein